MPRPSAAFFLPLTLLIPACHRSPSPSPVPEDPPPWAYVVAPKNRKPPPDDGGLLHVPDSAVALPFADLHTWFFTADWHPEDHPPMPEIVAHGRKPDLYACGVCHRADGPGGPENASLAGLPADYMTRQMGEFARGARKNPVPDRLPTTWMTQVARAATPAEVDAAVAYFAALKPRANLRVVETEVVPETAVSGWTLAETRSGRTEPIGARIVEVPEDIEQFENHDARSHFVAYVPPGSVARGRALATEAVVGRPAPCVSCHGPDLRGVAFVPRLAGRSPSYLVRQLFDMKHGARTGPVVAQMLPAVQGLDLDGMIAVAAYAASLPP